MTSKVEEVARAIAESAHGDGDGWVAWTDEARAAIKAMRDMNDAMLKEALQCGVYMPDFKEAWPNVIDAALGEEGR